MDPEAALDAAFVQTLPDLHFPTCGPTFKPSTCYNRGEEVVWNCYPHIPGTGAPRPGLFGLWDQMALLCPSTAYILLPSEPINQLYGDDIELLLDVAETLKRIRDHLNVDMYVVLIFSDVAPGVCQQYAHLFQADFALQGYAGHLIYQSLLHDLDTPEYHLRSTHFYRYPGLNLRRLVLSPVPRCSVLPQLCVPALLDPASPLKVTWKGSIFSSANEEYHGFRFLHSSNVGMPVGPVTFSSCNPPATTQSNLTRTRANFVITLDITSCDKTIELIETWRTLNTEVFLEYDEKLFIASWVPPRGYINHWHITAYSVQLSPSDVPPKVRPILPTRSEIQAGKEKPALTVFPSDVVDLPGLSLNDTCKMSKKGKKAQSVLFGQTKSFNRNRQGTAIVRAARNLQSASIVMKTPVQKDIIAVADAFAYKQKQSSFGKGRSSVRLLSGMKLISPTQNRSRTVNMNLQPHGKHLIKLRRDKKNLTKSRFRRKTVSKVDPRLVKVAMRQSFPNLKSPQSRFVAQEVAGISKNHSQSWSSLGRVGSEFDEQDFPKSNPPPTYVPSSSFHGIEYQDKDVTAEVEAAILISGVEFTNAPVKPERMSQVLLGLKELRVPSSASV